MSLMTTTTKMWRTPILVLVAILWITTHLVLPTQAYALESLAGEGTNVTAVINLEAELPCDISPPTPDDKPHLVLWYRESSGTPFYSLDVRDKPLESAKHFPTDDIRSRMMFRTPAQQPAFLLISEVTLADEGAYRCRVDFRSSPTRNTLVNLTVVVPPLPPTIMDEKAIELTDLVGPYNEGSSLFLSCEAREGKPPPMVSWWRDTTLLDDSYEVTSLGLVRNDLLVPTLSRSDFRASYTCQASNTNLTVPVATAVTVDMNLKPLDVQIRQLRQAMSAGKRYELECRSTGSRPLPIMAWWKGNKRMKRTEETTSPDDNVTTSILTFTPTNDDNGKYLSCRAENIAIPKSGIEDGWKLDIYFTPIVTLELGSSLKDNNIRQGDDVYFECNVRSNPWVHGVGWKFQGKYLPHNVTAGVIVSNQSLVIQRVKRENVGRYTCVGINMEGEGESNEVFLQIRHPPVCKSGQKGTYGVARNERAQIICEVEAYPTEVNFRWAFNRSSDGLDGAQAHAESKATRSTLHYLPKTERDYGTLACWGTNEMGTQLIPCVFHVVAAGPPDPVHNCTVYNQTESTMYVECRSGYDGGLAQNFVLEVYEANTHELKSSMTNPKPLFYVNGLQPGSSFIMSVFANNAKGRSESIPLAAATKHAQNTGNDNDIFSMTPILGVLIGVVAALAIVAIAIVVIMRCRATSNVKRRDYEQEQADRSNIPLRKDTDDTGGDNEEKSPDVIPSNNCKEDQEFPPVEVKCLQKQSYGGSERPSSNNTNSYLSAPDQSNHLTTWAGTRKVKPYDDVSYLEMQTPGNQRKAVMSRRPTDPKLYESGDVTRRQSQQRPYADDEVPSAETPLMMNSLPDTMVSV